MWLHHSDICAKLKKSCRKSFPTLVNRLRAFLLYIWQKSAITHPFS